MISKNQALCKYCTWVSINLCWNTLNTLISLFACLESYARRDTDYYGAQVTHMHLNFASSPSW